MKLWGGRFSGEQDERMRRFNDSLPFDRRLYAADIRGSLAYAEALQMAGLLTDQEQGEIRQGLLAVLKEFENGQFIEKPGDEDIHTAVERRLTELIGTPAGKLHTGRSRNDQVALDFRLYVLDAMQEIRSALAGLQEALVKQAEVHLGVIMPGYTHLQPAQPVLYSHWLMSYFWMFDRDQGRLADSRARTNISPLGSGALAGTPFKINRLALAEALSMSGVTWNSMDAVSDRDFAAEFQFAAAMIALHVSRLAEDLILFANPNFGYVTIAEEYSTGSSLMPQKRNPDSLELARGKTGRVIAGLLNLMIVLKGIPSTYNKDMQEDKEALFDTVDTLQLVLPVVAGVVETLRIHPDRMAAGLDDGMLATDLADYLVEKGLPFRQAHHVVGEVIRLSENRGVSLSGMSAAELKQLSPLFEPDAANIFNFEKSVGRRRMIGGTAPETVAAQIREAKSRISKYISQD